MTIKEAEYWIVRCHLWQQGKEQPVESEILRKAIVVFLEFFGNKMYEPLFRYLRGLKAYGDDTV